MATESRTVPTHGKWIVADHIPENPLGLLSVGDTYFAGDSLRSHLDKLGAARFVQQANNAAGSGLPVDTVARWEGSYVRVLVEPLLAPLTRVPVGVMGIITTPGAALPPRPTVGIVEWRVEKATKKVLQQVWGGGMVDLYESFAPVGNLAQWMNEAISPRGREVFEAAIRDGFELRNERFLVKYFIHPAGDRTREKELEFSGWTADDHDLQDQLWVRGIAREAHSGTPILRPLQETVIDLYQKAASLAAADCVFIRIDTLTWDCYVSLESLDAHDLAIPHEAQLAELVDPQCLEKLQRAISSASSGEIATVMLIGKVGRKPFTMKWSRLETAGSRFVLAYLRPKAD